MFHEKLKEEVEKKKEEAEEKAKDAYDSAAGAADYAAGSTDEAVARQFDDQKGGGVTDGLKSFTGVTAWKGSDQAAESREEYQGVESEGGLLGDAKADAKRFDIATQAGMDFMLDNPNASVQDTTRGGLQAIAGEDDKEEFAQGLQNTATNVSDTTEESIKGTPLDNKATDAVAWGVDALIADPAKAGLTAATGVDIDKGTSEGTIGAVDAFDVGVTVGTAGVGKAGTAGLKGLAKGADEALTLADDAATGADDAGGAFSRFMGGSDEASGPVARWGEASGAADEAAGAADDAAGAADDAAGAADDAATGTDETMDVFNLGDEGASATDNLPVLADDAAGAADDAAGAADDAAGAADEAFQFTDETATAGDDAAGAADESGRFSDFVVSAGDDVAAEASRASDEVGAGASRATDEATSPFSRLTARLGGLTDNLGRGADKAAQGADDAAGAAYEVAAGADDAGSLLTKRNAALGTGAFLAGGAATNLTGADDPRQAPDDLTTANGKDLSAVKSYKPVEKYPNGGKLFAVTEDFQNQGYWLLLGIQGRNLLVLDANGEPRQAQISAEEFSNMMSQQQGNGGGA